MDRATIQRARQADLARYLLSVGVPLERAGNRHRHAEHDSLIFTKNMYYWNSRQEHGNPIDYLTRHMGMDFKTAVGALANVALPIEPPIAAAPFDLSQVALCPNADRARAYLSKTRAVGYGIINHFIKSGLLFQEERTNNAVFPMYDEHNACVGAELQGISKKRFKGIKTGSQYGYGFNVRFSNDGTFGYALFFESAIDLASFIDIKINHEGKSLDKCVLVSMAGLKPNIVNHSLNIFRAAKAVLCVDNDAAGRAFQTEIKHAGIPHIVCAPNDGYKDWNEQLSALKSHGKPIQRLMRHHDMPINTDAPVTAHTQADFSQRL